MTLSSSDCAVCGSTACFFIVHEERTCSYAHALLILCGSLNDIVHIEDIIDDIIDS
jgi:hypothetical protein